MTGYNIAVCQHYWPPTPFHPARFHEVISSGLKYSIFRAVYKSLSITHLIYFDIPNDLSKVAKEPRWALKRARFASSLQPSDTLKRPLSHCRSAQMGKTADPFALPSVFFPPRYHLFEQNKKSCLFTFCHTFLYVIIGTIPLRIEAKRDLKIEKIALCLNFHQN